MPNEKHNTNRVSAATRKKFQDSQEAAMRRLIRNTVRKADLTKGERDVILALVNHWFHHKGTGRAIHPGRAKIAKIAGVTEKTVSRTFTKLRAAEILIPISNLNGGRQAATRYHINMDALMAFCGGDWLDTFRRFFTQNVPVKSQEMSRLNVKSTGTKCPTVLKGRFDPYLEKVFLPVDQSLIDYEDCFGGQADA